MHAVGIKLLTSLGDHDTSYPPRHWCCPFTYHHQCPRTVAVQGWCWVPNKRSRGGSGRHQSTLFHTSESHSSKSHRTVLQLLLLLLSAKSSNVFCRPGLGSFFIPSSPFTIFQLYMWIIPHKTSTWKVLFLLWKSTHAHRCWSTVNSLVPTRLTLSLGQVTLTQLFTSFLKNLPLH